MAELDDNYYRLENERDSNEHQQQNMQNQIDDIDDQIRRLRAAYNTLDGQKEGIKLQKTTLGYLKDLHESTWKGEHATAVYDSCGKDGTLSSTYQTYINGIDWIEDSINDEIARLKNLRSEKWGILQGLVCAWNDLCAEIRNYFN